MKRINDAVQEAIFIALVIKGEMIDGKFTCKTGRGKGLAGI